MQKWVIGIDEAGRGPLAGPVAVGVALVPADFDWDLIPGVGDSKQVTKKNREAIFLRVKELQKPGLLDFAVVMVSAKIIDAKGIVPAVTIAMEKALSQLRARIDLALINIKVKLDGGLKAPFKYVHQETIIKGDAKERVIGLASIMAKVTRDHYMERIATKPDYIAYNFGQHKGYGTKAHREAIQVYGLSTIHRATFCKNVNRC